MNITLLFTMFNIPCFFKVRKLSIKIMKILQISDLFTKIEEIREIFRNLLQKSLWFKKSFDGLFFNFF